ncbi:hypothetical protein LWI29_010875 [Acer saccharum]|uniref:SLC26A/SulP transporter domain-containing protein n=1 Tax=Acer saccharum TaxID=4024 RepID=A0AA39SCV1_ACESA|nr:hypothetical protein LWI29_010875 [Acer saccharum]
MSRRVSDHDVPEGKEMEINSAPSSRRYSSENSPYVHKVGVPPKQDLLKEFTSAVKETFFADDPLRPFKDQTGSRKVFLGIQTLFPIFDWTRDYNLSKFKGDFIAGLTIASLCIPQGKKNKKFFWVPAIAPLISVIISTFSVYITHAEKHGVQIVRHIDKGVNPLSAKDIFFTGEYLVKGSCSDWKNIRCHERLSIGWKQRNGSIRNHECVGSMTSCYVATGSFSRSAVNYMAGCNTAVSNIVMSMVVLLTLELITPLFKYTPNAILASIIISAVIGLIDIEAVILLWKIDKFDFVACMGAFRRSFCLG